MMILPAVLARNEDDFRKRIMHTGLRAAAAVWHVDILDGSMFGASCWVDPAVVGTWSNLPRIELHIMTHNPLPHVDAWRTHVPTVERAIIHEEIARPLGVIIERITQHGLEAGLALNPETPIEKAAHWVAHLQVLQLMGVHPGASGKPFLGEQVLAKARRARALYPTLALSVDGGVGAANAHTLCAAGATRLVCGSALWSTEDPAVALAALQESTARTSVTR